MAMVFFLNLEVFYVLSSFFFKIAGKLSWQNALTHFAVDHSAGGDCACVHSVGNCFGRLQVA